MTNNKSNAIPVEFIKEKMEDAHYKWSYSSKKVEQFYKGAYMTLQSLLREWEQECQKVD